jgi:integrase
MRNTMKGIRRTNGIAANQKTPTLTDDIRAMANATDAGPIGARDRALILLGFAGAFRRSELIRLNVEDCAFGKDGLTVTSRRSTTDQEGVGRKIGIHLRLQPGDLPRACFAKLVRTGRNHYGPSVPLNRLGQVQANRLSDIDVARLMVAGVPPGACLRDTQLPYDAL